MRRARWRGALVQGQTMEAWWAMLPVSLNRMLSIVDNHKQLSVPE